jgi:transketolase
MSGEKTKTMRDALIDRISLKMQDRQDIFFVSADMGAPALDQLRTEFNSRFINVGISEQNLVNVCTGLALEGFTVYAYAIACFLTMRAYEQIRNNLALMSQQRSINVNLIGVGAGVSYDMSGPSHHCLEDISIMRTLPNIMVCSPADWLTAEQFADFSLAHPFPKYIRLDGKALPRLYKKDETIDWNKGFSELIKGRDTCIVSTGYMTHKALQIAEKSSGNGKPIGVVDVFLLKLPDKDALSGILGKYKTVVTLEEAFVGGGGLDCLVTPVLSANRNRIRVKNFGFKERYVFTSGNREILHQTAGLSEEDILAQLH